MKKNVLLAFMALMCIAKSFAYDKVVFTNYTNAGVNVEVNYAACRNDKFYVAPGATASPSASRGACLITWISATGASNYTSSGTGYSRFAVVEFNGKNEVHRVDADGTILDLSSGYPNVTFKNYTNTKVDVEVNYMGCKNDKFSVEPGKTGTPSVNRGACLLTWISATGAAKYTSTGTSYSTFGLIEYNGRTEVHRVDNNGKPLDISDGGYPNVRIVNKTDQTISGKISYLSAFCSNDNYSVAPGQTFVAPARGVCLLTGITGTSQNGKNVISYTSSGTSFSKFGIIKNPVTEEFEAHRVDDNGVACDIQPGFIIRNKTEFPVEVSLDQLGCLYHGVIMPNQVMERNTGGVWFTINYQLNMDATPKIDDFKDCVLPIAETVASSLAAAATGGVSAGLTAAAKQAAKIVAKKLAKEYLTEVAAKEMANLGINQLQVAVCKAFIKNGILTAKNSVKYAFKGKNTNGIKSIDQLTSAELKEDFETKYSGKLYGQYAGSPLGLYEKPTYEITNGPTIDILNPNDPTPTAVINTVDGSSSGLCITKVNTVGDDMMPLSSKSKCDPNTNKNTPTKPLTNTPSTTPVAAKFAVPAGSIWTYSQNNQTLLKSPNGKFTLVYQGDGNLVLYKNVTTPIWASNTDRKSSATFQFQTDGNLVIYGAGNSVVWSPNCHGKGGQTLTLQDDGNLVVYTAANKPIWATGTNGK